MVEQKSSYQELRGDASGSAPMHQIDRIIVVLDGSALAAQAIPPAASLAEELGISMVLLGLLTAAPGRPARDDALHRSLTEGYLQAMSKPLQRRGLELQCQIDDMQGTVLQTLLAAHGLLLTTRAVVSVDTPLSRLALACRDEQPHAVLIKEVS